MRNEDYSNYPETVAIEIDGDPVLGYHILMATWAAGRKFGHKRVVDPGVGYRIIIEQTMLKFGFMVHAFGSSIDPREDYKSFAVSSRYTFQAARPITNVLREAAMTFGKSVSLCLTKQLRLEPEPPPLEGYMCLFPHRDVEKEYLAVPVLGGYDCPTHGFVTEEFIERRMIELLTIP